MRRFKPTNEPNNDHKQKLALLEWIGNVAYHGVTVADNWLHRSGDIPDRNILEPPVNPMLAIAQHINSQKSPNIFLPIPRNGNHGTYLHILKPPNKLTHKQCVNFHELQVAGYSIFVVPDMYAGVKQIKLLFTGELL